MRNGIRVALVLVTLVAPGLCFDSLAPVSHADDSEKLTPSAAAAVERLFPDATILLFEDDDDSSSGDDDSDSDDDTVT